MVKLSCPGALELNQASALDINAKIVVKMSKQNVMEVDRKRMTY